MGIRIAKFLSTTCATVLTRAIFTEGCKSVAAGMNVMDLRRGITMAVDAVVTNLKSRARMISTSEEIAQSIHVDSVADKTPCHLCKLEEESYTGRPIKKSGAN
ncbi:hypothetical protein G4B88_018573 [Cannabis sativa]|uniref:Uncharacterized protein n=1 Tax=Cannabis sativa TaxID=3483 RepID=A0A7J6HGH9_CANSA|nr:hypothetical protein G4B88_018573 [Cannabis sativa]